jgi:quercetin dioxygenase-like cupin family protein
VQAVFKTLGCTANIAYPGEVTSPFFKGGENDQYLENYDMIAVQTGSVVSRTLFNQKSGTLTLFAFDAGQSLSEHTAPFDAFAQVLEGQLEIRIDGEAHVLSAGEMILMPANLPHALVAQTPAKMLLTMLRAN